MNTTKTLWSDTTRTRHFVIPDSQQLAAGDFELRTVIGRQQYVDRQTLAPFEVSHEQAKAWLKDQFGQVVESTKTAIMDSIRSKMASEPDLDAWFGQRTDEPSDPPYSDPLADEPADINPLEQLASLFTDARNRFSDKFDEAYDKVQGDQNRELMAERLEALATGIENAAANAAERLRVQAKALRQHQANEQAQAAGSKEHHE